MKKTDELRKLRAMLVHALERLANARIDHSLTDDIRGTKVDMIKKEIEIIKADIKKLGV
jgi:hypothetical protein